MSRSFDPSLPSMNRNFDDISKKVDGTGYTTTIGSEELDRVFTQILYVHGHRLPMAPTAVTPTTKG